MLFRELCDNNEQPSSFEDLWKALKATAASIDPAEVLNCMVSMES